MIDNLKKKIWMIITSGQVLVVTVAFGLMVFLSYSFMSNIVRGHLIRDVSESIEVAQAKIEAELLEPGTAVGIIAENVRNMILDGESYETIESFLFNTTRYMQQNNRMSLCTTGVYAAFDTFGGIFFNGIGWNPPEDYEPRIRPWYIAAEEAGGDVGISQPFLETYNNELIQAFSRQIYDDQGKSLGVICLGIKLDRIREIAVKTYDINGGYGILLDSEFNVLAHPHPAFLGRSLLQMNDGPAIEKELRGGRRVSERIATDYKGDTAVLFVEKINNGWYLAVMAYSKVYYQSITRIAYILVSLGLGLSVILSAILVYMAKSRNKANEYIKAMFNASPLGANLWDKHHKLVDCNQEELRLFGVTVKQEFIGNFYVFSPEYQPDGSLSTEKGEEYIKKAFEEGYCRFDWMHKKLNGDLLPCEITLVRIMNKKDYMVAGHVRDLSENKKMMKAIEQQGNLLNTVNIAAIVLLSNHDEESFKISLLRSFELIGNCLESDRVQIWQNEMINSEMHYTLKYQWISEYGKTRVTVPIGFSYSYSENKNWEKMLLHGENINLAFSSMQQEDHEFLNKYDMQSTIMIPMFLDDHLWGFFSLDDCRKERVFLKEEISILNSAGLMITIAINHNMQNVKMREAEERMQILFDSSPFASTMFDENYNVIECNPETLNLFELSSKQEYMERFTDLSPEYQPCGRLSKEKQEEEFHRAFIDGYNRIEWTHKKLNGELIPAEITMTRVKYRGEFAITAYIRDLREIKALMTEMRKAEIAEESNKAKSNFLARMSHEIRTPMNAILGIAEIQLQDETLPKIVREALARIYNSGDLLLGIINDILDLSKIEAGKLELMPAKYDISSLISDTVQLNVMRYESKPILFKLQVDENLPCFLLGDELRIKQILNNILSNAYKYTQEGTINMSVGLDAGNETDKSRIMIIFRISDTGQGMTQEQVDKLGLEYTRFNMDANRTTGGTGLGMSITQNLLKMMNGKMIVDSVPGMGSTFTIYLPQRTAGSETLGNELVKNLEQFNVTETADIKKTQITHEFMPYGRVLVVDDVETNIYVARGLMAPYGLSIDAAFSGYDAIDKVKAGNVYDIIFMDHMMPKMDGIEAANIIRSLGYTKPIIALTANALAGMEEVFLKNGFDDFISKPIDIRQLNMVLNKMIRDMYPSEVIEAAREQKASMKQSEPIQPQVSLNSKLAELFIKDAKKAIAVLEAIHINKCRRADDVSMFIINIHAMKTALANIGEQELSSAANKLEQAGRDRKVEEILTDIPEFLKELNGVIEKFSLLEKNSASGSPQDGEDITTNDKDREFLHEKLKNIQNASRSFDKKEIKKTLTKLKEKKWPRSVKELLDVIGEHLLHSEFDEVSQVAQQAMDVSDVF